ncbi:hypothetical protein MTR_8g093450 [Medicago truncatula]|uniref:Uncharacterized protein n=1 Tax=Medicago truncatula TaxID=3880 RepID=G7LD85_MEDTR|nr:hypothetical protein MTR_8g093450 [Medicago truncatula]
MNMRDLIYPSVSLSSFFHLSFSLNKYDLLPPPPLLSATVSSQPPSAHTHGIPFCDVVKDKKDLGIMKVKVLYYQFNKEEELVALEERMKSVWEGP